ncbi:MAG: hypothetical protein HOE53_01180 [Candidatus Magasanikbacteria bacterium]|jgi:hypothetical protein|nr:hypothetical protein [Candidatus Magasanikbacteria bacterium]
MPALNSQKDKQRAANQLTVQRNAQKQQAAQMEQAAQKDKTSSGKKIQELQTKVDHFSPTIFWYILIALTLIESLVGMVPLIGTKIVFFLSPIFKTIRVFWFILQNKDIKAFILDERAGKWLLYALLDLIPFINIVPWTMAADYSLFKDLFGEYYRLKDELKAEQKKAKKKR